MPVYHAETTVSRAILSCEELNNLNPGVKLIAIDDCSADGSYDVLTSMAATRPFIKVIRNLENIGPGGTRNKALSVVDTEYIGFIDADDELIASKYMEALFSMVCSDNDLITFDAVTERNGAFFSRYDRELLVSKNVNLAKLCLQGRLDGCVLYSIFRRSLVNSNNICFGRYFFEDIEFFYKSLISSKNFNFFDAQCYVKHDTENSILTGMSTKHIEGLLSSVVTMHDFVVEKNIFTACETQHYYSYCVADYLFTIFNSINSMQNGQEKQALIDFTLLKSKEHNFLNLLPFSSTKKGAKLNEIFLNSISDNKLTADDLARVYD